MAAETSASISAQMFHRRGPSLTSGYLLPFLVIETLFTADSLGTGAQYM